MPTDLPVPDIKVKINGNPIEGPLLETFRGVEIHQSTRLIDMAVLSFDNPGGVIGDQAELAQGSEVSVEIGYVGQVAWVFKGDVVSLEPEFPITGAPSVVVRAYDRLHRYRRGRKTRTFLNQKVSEVVTTLAGEDGL